MRGLCEVRVGGLQSCILCRTLTNTELIVLTDIPVLYFCAGPISISTYLQRPDAVFRNKPILMVEC